MNYERSGRLFFVIAAAAFIAIIGLYFLDFSDDGKQKEMYDNNNYISQGSDSYTYRERVQGPDEKNLDLKFQGFTGSDTIWLVQASQPGQISINYEANVTSGRFKIVVVSPEREVSIVAESPRKGSHSFKLTEGEYRIKMVGEKAQGNIKASLDTGQGIAAELQDHDF